MPVGRVLPMFCTAAGRAYLSRLPIEEVNDVLHRSALRPLAAMTVTHRKRVLALVAEAREAGHSRANQECYRGDLTIGAAVMGPHGWPVAAINIYLADYHVRRPVAEGILVAIGRTPVGRVLHLRAEASDIRHERTP
jgi:DNA-binding IclR family transcriptional regulator